MSGLFRLEITLDFSDQIFDLWLHSPSTVLHLYAPSDSPIRRFENGLVSAWAEVKARGLNVQPPKNVTRSNRHGHESNASGAFSLYGLLSYVFTGGMEHMRKTKLFACYGWK